MNYKSASLSLSTLALCLIGLAASANAAPTGNWNCSLDGKEWKDTKGGATQNGDTLTLYSDNDRVEGLFIMMGQPVAVGNFDLNGGAQASYADPQGVNFKSTEGSGKLTISKFTPPQGATLGSVEGTFSATFSKESAKPHGVSGCTFNLPVKILQ